MIGIRLICHKDSHPKRNNFSKNTCLQKIYKVNSYGGGLMHNKFCIIDNEILIIGSYNWSANAHRHFENIFVIENEFPSILRYKNEFEDLIIASYSISYKRCPQCNSTTINMLVTASDDDSRENFYKLSIWEICLKNNHCQRIYNEVIEEHGWIEEEKEPIEDKEIMLYEFKKNRKTINNHIKYINKFNIHLLAYPVDNNSAHNMKFRINPEYCLKVYWKHIFFRNSINSEYYNNGFNDIHKIIEWANETPYY